MAGTKADAERFSREWAGKGDENQDTQRFWISLLQDVLGVDDAIQRVRFEVPVQTDASDHNGYVDVFIPSARVIVEQKSLGIDLSKPEKRQGRMVTPAQQALAYAQGMPLTQQPRYVVVCNFAELWVYDREANALCKGDPLFKLPLSELPKNLAAIQFLAGEGTAPTTLSEAVSVKAGKIMGHLHDLVAASFIDPNAPESHHALSVLMTRLMFLMFCEDAGLVEPNAFRDYIQHFQAPDLRQGLKDLFCWLDTPDAERDPYAGEWLRRLPYMNGGLFREQTEIPPLSEDFRTTLIVEGCQEFDWSGVSPTVFGSIFEGPSPMTTVVRTVSTSRAPKTSIRLSTRCSWMSSRLSSSRRRPNPSQAEHVARHLRSCTIAWVPSVCSTLPVGRATSSPRATCV